MNGTEAQELIVLYSTEKWNLTFLRENYLLVQDEFLHLTIAYIVFNAETWRNILT